MKSTIEARLRKIESQVQPKEPQPVLQLITKDPAECDRLAAENPDALTICRLLVSPPAREALKQ